ncbi:MAG: hypothetical protein J0I47_15470 [Sphingomonas sp.]|uniref:hypothetical protein n=1 Tax=Sphingomonas sp. TaxID=28214 RepID=UPI001AC0835C|nr:hypothetical protein [Sphingomonas sp.]MBN8809618.1 hypothetical protein [Sphingomonas sp.]
MDLSYLRFEHDARAAVLPPDLAVLLVGVAARQAASPTARAQAVFDRPVALDLPFRPAGGAFDVRQAERLRRWDTEMKAAFT